MNSVLQEWVMEMGWKQQSILLSGLRGPDGTEAPAVKAVGRWLRRVSQHNADPSKDYMRQDALPVALAVCDELEWMSCHFVHHFADAVRVVAINHPDKWTREYASELHYRIAEEIFHFMPESDTTFLYRHRDRTNG